MIIKDKCEQCIHNEVCSIKDQLADLKRECESIVYMDGYGGEIPITDNKHFILSIECKHFNASVLMRGQ